MDFETHADPIRSTTPKGGEACLTMTVEQAAKALGISRGSAYALAGKGDLPTIRLGRRMLVPRHAVERLVGLVT
jgi:excisionase family DNA binding protein